MSTVKAELRGVVRGQIGELSQEYIDSSNLGIFQNMTALPEFKSAETLMIYYSVDREPDTVRIAARALELGKRVAFPYCCRGGIMDARLVLSLDELKPAMLGIPAPADDAPVIGPDEIDLIIVPALTYDSRGFRLGYGGGYYDRYLPQTRAFMVGVARESLLRDALPHEPHDVSVDCLVTEKQAARLG